MEGVIRDRATQVGVPYATMENGVPQPHLDAADDGAGRRRRHGPVPAVADPRANVSGQSLGVDGNVESL